MISPLSVIRTESSAYIKNLHLTIYIPVSKEISGSNKSRNRVRFCMSLRKIEKMLLDKGFSFIKVREIIKPLEMKLDSNIWRKDCAAVIIFYFNGMIKIFTSQMPLPQMEVIDEAFYTEPLTVLPEKEYMDISNDLRKEYFGIPRSFAS